MIGKNQVGRTAYEQTVFQIHTHLFNFPDLFHQCHRVNYNSIADNTGGIAIKHSGWNQMQDNNGVIKFEGMSCIGSALIPDHIICIRTQQVNNLSLSFIAPLGANYNSYSHVLKKKKV